MTPQTPDDDADFGPSGRLPSPDRHPLYDNLSEFRMAERRIPAMGAADTGRVVFHAQMRFPGGCEVFYARAVKLDDYDIADETEIARSACYSQVGESVCGNTVVPDAAEVVRRVANIRRRL